MGLEFQRCKASQLKRLPRSFATTLSHAKALLIASIYVLMLFTWSAWTMAAGILAQADLDRDLSELLGR